MANGLRFPKPLPHALTRDARKAHDEAQDKRGSAEARTRANGRCEIWVIGEGRCRRVDRETHHRLGGWRMRGRGVSATAGEKIRVCAVCHAALHARTLVQDGQKFRRIRFRSVT
jgi:hypothetical protein